MNPQTTKHFEFTGQAGDFFVMWIVTTIMNLIPFVGFALGFNYQNEWLMKNIKIDGRSLTYKAGFGETWVFLFVGILLTLLTFGIYVFWFAPKAYRYILDHTTYNDEVTTTPAPTAQTPPVPANDTTPPNSPAPPASPLVQ